MSQGVQHILLNYEVTPPSGVWNKIAAELDESALDHSFPSTLYHAEIIPPADAWDKIENSLYDKQDSAIPQRRRLPAFARYVAAAVIIGLVAWGGIRLLKSSSEENGLVKTQSPLNNDIDKAAAQDPVQEPGKASITTTTIDPEEARNDVALEASKKTFAKLEIPANHRRLRNIAAAYSFASGDELSMPVTQEVCPPDLSTRYIVMMTPEGNIIRMSKKLSNLVCCVSGEDEDQDCKDQMSKWREKIALSPTGHSTGSFLDLLSLVNSSQDQ